MNQQGRLCYTFVQSPIGKLLLVAEGPLLAGLYLNPHEGGPTPQTDWRADDGPFDEVRRQLDAYFAGRLQTFDLPLRLAGTPFQRRVWQELVRIPFGETISYADLAARVGQDGAARAVGNANGKNPISIVVPCHRVIRSGGALGGYGGGLDAKRWLLDFERRVAAGADYLGASVTSRSPSMAANSGRS